MSMTPLEKALADVRDLKKLLEGCARRANALTFSLDGVVQTEHVARARKGGAAEPELPKDPEAWSLPAAILSKIHDHPVDPRMRPINEIVVHCSATPPDWMKGTSVEEKVARIADFHVRLRGWRAIGYALMIDRDGSIGWGRDLDDDGDVFDDIGAHVRGRNSRSIGLCLLGGKVSRAHDRFSQHFTAQQDHALRAVIRELQKRFPSIGIVSGHNQYAAKACPGFQVPAWLADDPMPLE